MSKKMAMASLSYDPATEREMYPGAIPMKAAARRPADSSFNSLAKRYVAKAVSPEKAGARRTQMFRISTGSLRIRRMW